MSDYKILKIGNTIIKSKNIEVVGVNWISSPNSGSQYFVTIQTWIDYIDYSGNCPRIQCATNIQTHKCSKREFIKFKKLGGF